MSRWDEREPTLHDLGFRLEVMGPATTDSIGCRQIAGVVSWMMSRPDERPELGIRLFVVVEPGATEAETQARMWAAARTKADMFVRALDAPPREQR